MPRRSRHDKVAFAIHAFLLAQGFKLVATGAVAEDDTKGRPVPARRPSTPCMVLVKSARPCLTAACHHCSQTCCMCLHVDFEHELEEVGPEGWDSLEDAYAFRYQDTEGEGHVCLSTCCHDYSYCNC